MIGGKVTQSLGELTEAFLSPRHDDQLDDLSYAGGIWRPVIGSYSTETAAI